MTSEDNICRWDDFVTSRGQLYEEGIWGEVKEHFLHLTPAPLPHLQELAGSPTWAIYIIYAMRVFVGNDSYQTSKIFKILLSFLFSMEWYWMQGRLIPTCLCTSGRSVILSKVQHLWNRLEIVQSLMMKVSFGSSKFCPSLYSLGIITSKLNLLFWNALQNVVFKLHSDGLPDLSLNLNKLHFSSLCKVWTVVENMLLNWIIILSWAALVLIYLMFSNKEKKKLVLKQIILSIGLAVWLGRCQVAPTTGSE